MSGQEPLLQNRPRLLSCTVWAGYEERLTFGSGVLAMTVGMVGTGSVAFPYGFALCGSVGGPVVLAVVAFLSYLSYDSLIQCGANMRVGSYGALTVKLSKTWDLFGKFALWSVLVLSVSAYVLISANIVKSLVAASPDIGELGAFLTQDPVLYGLIILLVLPLCLMKTMRGLGLITSYCTFALFGVIVLLVLQALQILKTRGGDELPEKLKMTTVTSPISMLMAMPIFGTAMFGHMNVCQIHAELKPHLKEKASLVALTATVFTFAIYCVIAYAGYVAFGSSADPDILKQIAGDVGETPMVLMTQGLLASFIILKAPLLVLPARQVTFDTLSPGEDYSKVSTGKHVGLTVVVLGCIYLAAVAIPDLGKLLQVVGAVSAIPIVFIVPARLAWEFQVPRPTVRCLVMGIFGGIVSLVCLCLIFGPNIGLYIA